MSDIYKNRARRLRKHLALKGIKIGHSASLHAVAAEEQANSWQELIARPNKTESSRYSKEVTELMKVDVHNSHPNYSREDWRDEVANDNTHLGYWEWVDHRLEENGLEEKEIDWIDACAHSDDYVHRINSFNALPWLVKASDDQILDLFENDFTECKATDFLISFSKNLNPEVKAMTNYLHGIADLRSSKNTSGFTCCVSSYNVIDWVRKNKPNLWVKALKADLVDHSFLVSDETKKAMLIHVNCR